MVEPTHRPRPAPALVVDASAMAEVLLNSTRGHPLAEVLRHHDLHVPNVLIAEVLSVVRGHVLGGLLDRSAAQLVAQDLCDLPLTVWDERPFVRDILALIDNVTAYDACYVALAGRLAAPLLTLDAKLSAAARHVIDLHPRGATGSRP